MKRLQQIEQENGRLKKLVADLTLNVDLLKDVSRNRMVSARVRRQQVAFVQTHGLSCRRACALLLVARPSVGYVSRLQARDAPAVMIAALLALTCRG